MVNFKSSIIKILYLACVAVSCSANAIQVFNLYTVEVPAIDKQTSTRADLLSGAFDSVLVKISGSKDILMHDGLDSPRKNASDYVQRYSYKNKIVGNENGLSQEQTFLVVNFNESMINSLISSLEKPYLGSNRPLTTVWLDIEGDMLDRNQIEEILEELADNYGIPVALPLLDLQDRSNVEDFDIKNFDEHKLTLASQRYGADIILAGAVRNFAGHWMTSWKIINADGAESWKINGLELDTQIEEVLSRLSEYMVKNYGNAAHNDFLSSSTNIKVSGINRVEDYARIYDYLRNLSNVDQVEVYKIESTMVEFKVTADGGFLSLQKTIALDRVLVPEGSANPDSLEYKVGT